MTYDQTEIRLWYNGEYKLLDKSTLNGKLTQHRTHCPYKETTNEIKAWTKTLQELSSN